MDRMDTALQAAWEAGDILRGRFARPKQVIQKGYRDFVTDADFAAQAAIVGAIRRAYPDHAIMAEEGTGEEIESGSSVPLWVIDPLDGTTNFSRQFPSFGVSIGLVEGGTPVLGVIHDPLRGHSFIAERGHGAHWLSEDSDPVSLHVSATASLHDAVIGVDWSHADEDRRATLDALRPVALACRSVRAIGSAALALAYLSAGWLDGYLHFSLLPWDAAAGAVLITEAGGRLTGPDGAPWTFGQEWMLASNGGIHEEFMTGIQGLGTGGYGRAQA